MSKPRLCEVLGVELMEEFQRPGQSIFYRVNRLGQVEERKEGHCTWQDMACQCILEEMIEKGICKVPKKTPIDEDQLRTLRALAAIFEINEIYNGMHGVHFVSNDNNQLVYLPKGNCLGTLFTARRTSFNIQDAISKGEL